MGDDEESGGSGSVLWIGSERANRLPGEWSGIAIGAVKAAMDPAALKEAGVTHVVNAGAFAYERHPDVRYLDIDVQDCLDSNLHEHFGNTNCFLSRAAGEGGLTLVHCAAGRSRSPTLVAAYLIEQGDMTADEAVEMVSAARPIAQPNPSFHMQLMDFRKDIVNGRNANSDDGSDELWGGGGRQQEASTLSIVGVPLGTVSYRAKSGHIKRGTLGRTNDGDLRILASSGAQYVSVDSWLKESEFDELGPPIDPNWAGSAWSAWGGLGAGKYAQEEEEEEEEEDHGPEHWCLPDCRGDDHEGEEEEEGEVEN